MRALTIIVTLAAATTALHAKKAPADMLVLEEPMPARTPRFPPPPAGPPPQVTALASDLAGTWSCRGTANGHAITGAVTIDLALGGAWLRAATTWRDGETTATTIEHRTYDVVARQWVRILIGPGTAHATQTSLGPNNNAWSWTGEGTAAETQRASRLELAMRRDGFEITCRR